MAEPYCIAVASSPELVAAIFHYTLGFPIFNRGVDYIIIYLLIDVWHFGIMNFTSYLLSFEIVV